jgi:hypothetical protein
LGVLGFAPALFFRCALDGVTPPHMKENMAEKFVGPKVAN